MLRNENRNSWVRIQSEFYGNLQPWPASIRSWEREKTAAAANSGGGDVYEGDDDNDDAGGDDDVGRGGDGEMLIVVVMMVVFNARDVDFGGWWPR